MIVGNNHGDVGRKWHLCVGKRKWYNKLNYCLCRKGLSFVNLIVTEKIIFSKLHTQQQQEVVFFIS